MDLKMEVTQTLGLSQRMIQSTEILQMSAQELDTYLKELAVENPVVDIEEKFDKSGESERDAELQKKLEWLASSDEQNRVYYSEEYSSDDDDNQDMWNVSDNRGEDLAEYLISQLVTIPLTDKEQAIAEYLIDLLDSRGYLTEETDQIAAQLETEEDEVARMLQVVQSLEPAGVGARNLSECLLIQMDRQKIEDTIARKIAANYLEQLGKNQLPQIARKLKVTVDDFLYVNDKSVDEAYISKDKSAYLATVSPGNFFTDDFSIATLTDNKQTKIEKGQYLVLNDNRRNTDDSRKFGLIEKDQIKGVISFRLYPLSRFGFVDVD